MALEAWHWTLLLNSFHKFSVTQWRQHIHTMVLAGSEGFSPLSQLLAVESHVLLDWKVANSNIQKNAATPSRRFTLLWHVLGGGPTGFIQSKEWVKGTTSLFAGALALELSEGDQLEALQSCIYCDPHDA